ncbi:hypothetical protein LC048_17880 [Mesobacillus subterraneus]|uniref:hypothetical protein n=1 Tax=Mesobacillus subterraneus TaxID=285983 RepID=UPI001CFDFFB1|nr:hypothetical protein [Mesobacillus subterraneus]WLR54297.1 hypothetical protein LC048_17880 [Mesobacillus subterraneus]
MNVKTRTTAQGTEYWDAKEKRIRFVPAGQDPDFEVTENPKSMVMGVDQAKGKDHTVITMTVDDKEIAKVVKDLENDLDNMDAEQLLAYAKEKDIDVPGNMKKADTIRDHIKEELAATEE